MQKLWFSIFFIFIFAKGFSNPMQLYETGKKYQQQEKWYDAIEYYQSALAENPSYNLVFQGLAECFYALSEYDQALSFVQKALVYKRNSSELQGLHGFILIGLGRLSEAKQIFSSILKTYPNNLSARFGLAEIEVSAGKLLSATALYEAALARQNDNRKALLSLALISYESGQPEIARDYINRALRYHGDSPQVHYFAAYLAAMDSDNVLAENRARAALKLNAEYDSAKALLASVLYAQGRYKEAVRISDDRISRNRNIADAWYLKTLSQLKNRDIKAAMQSAKVGLSIDPENEIMRAVLEEIAIDNLNFEDNYRKRLAQFHVEKANAFSNRNIIQPALYEYRRALKVYPYDVESRYAYAKLLLRLGYQERYLEQLEFIQSITKSNTKVNDAVETYSKRLSTSLQSKWNINPLYLDKGHISIALFYQLDPSNVFHPEAEKVATKMIADIFSYNRRFTINSYIAKPHNYRDAFKTARTSGNDYFGIVHLYETERDIKMSIDLYVARTGAHAKTFSVFRSANDRYANALRRLAQMLAKSMPHVGKIVKRYQSEALIDLGKNDGDYSNTEFQVVEKGKIVFAREGIGIVFSQDDVLGSFIPKKTNEDLTSGTLKRKGYYDRMNTGDYIITTIKEDTDIKTEIKKNKSGKSVEVQQDLITLNKQEPILLKLLRTIRQFDR
ncbi:MAG: hypothetical protein CR988_05980 [Treponema sp.]|nr:MAG: hypothetical protein CR988_05980 [Treponema sp.]